MKFNIEPLKGFPLNNDQKETLLCLIKKMCDESNDTKPAQANEPIQITIYPNPNSSTETFVSTKFGTTVAQYVDWTPDSIISLYIKNDELFEYVEKNIQHCTFELIASFNIDSGLWIRTNQYILQYAVYDGVLDEYSCDVYFEFNTGETGFYFQIKIQKNT